MAGWKHSDWEGGKVSGAVYHGGEELLELQAKAMRRFAVSNPLHPDVFPGVRRMEAEVVAMVGGLFHMPNGGGGLTTSGGTESILLACLAARGKAAKEKGVTEPEMFVPHPQSHLIHPISSLTQSLGSSPSLPTPPSTKQPPTSTSSSTRLQSTRRRSRLTSVPSPVS